MPIDFQIHGLQIRNFRGLQHLDVEFAENATTALIGANNACKSTILDAIAFVLGGPSFYNYTPDKYDFYHDADGSAANEFEITISFTAGAGVQLPAVRGAFGDPVPVHGARVTGSTEKNSRYAHETRLIDAQGDAILLPSALPLKGPSKAEWKEHKNLSFRQRYARWSDISGHRPDVWHLRPDNLFVSLYQWKSGPLQRLAAMLARQFFENKWEFEYDKKTRQMPESLYAAHRFLVAAVQQLPFWQKDLRPKLEETLSLYVGRQATIDLKPDIRAIEDWLAEQLALSFAADAGGARTPLAKMGDGWQSLVRVAALDVLSQYPEKTDSQVVLLFEEPESFLHPHLARKLRGVLDHLAAKGWMVVITTHSPNLVSFGGNQSIVRLTRADATVAARSLRAAEVDGAAKFQERLDERGAHEMLFAQRAVLCEGQDDTFAVRSHLIRRCGLDLDGRCVSIIRAGDVGQLPAFAGMASKLGIPWCAVSDEDRLPDGTIKPVTKDVRDLLTTLQSAVDGQVQWPVDLETSLGKAQGKANPAWQAQHIEPKNVAAMQRDHPEYLRACEGIKAWVMR